MVRNSWRAPPTNPEHRVERLGRDDHLTSLLARATIDTSPPSGSSGRAGHLRHEERLYMEQGSQPSLKPGIGAARYHELPHPLTRDEIWAKAVAESRGPKTMAPVNKGPKPS